MSAVKFSKGSEEWMMFTDFWQLCQKHWEVELTDEYILFQIVILRL